MWAGGWYTHSQSGGGNRKRGRPVISVVNACAGFLKNHVGGVRPFVTKQTSLIPEEALRRAQHLLSKWEISPEFTAGLIGSRSPITFTKGQPIFTHGSTADIGFCVLSGLVKLYLPFPDGSRIIVRLAGPGDFIGIVDTAGSDGRHVHALEAEAMSKASVSIFTRDHVMAMLKSAPVADLVDLLQEINTTWSEIFASSIRFLGLSFRDRLKSVLQSLAGRYGVQEARGILLTIELSQDDLAEMIASSRPMVSRLLAEFVEQEEMVRQGRRYILIDPGAKKARSASQQVKRNPLSTYNGLGEQRSRLADGVMARAIGD